MGGTNTSLENFALSGITVGLSLTLGIGVVMLIPSVLTTKVQSHPVVQADRKTTALKGGLSQGVERTYDTNVDKRPVKQQLPPGDPVRKGPTAGTENAQGEDQPVLTHAERSEGIMRSLITTERPTVSNHMGGRKGYIIENVAVNFYRDQCAGEGIKVQPGGAPPCTESVYKSQYDLDNGVIHPSA